MHGLLWFTPLPSSSYQFLVTYLDFLPVFRVFDSISTPHLASPYPTSSTSLPGPLLDDGSIVPDAARTHARRPRHATLLLRRSLTSAFHSTSLCPRRCGELERCRWEHCPPSARGYLSSNADTDTIPVQCMLQLPSAHLPADSARALSSLPPLLPCSPPNPPLPPLLECNKACAPRLRRIPADAAQLPGPLLLTNHSRPTRRTLSPALPPPLPPCPPPRTRAVRVSTLHHARTVPAHSLRLEAPPLACHRFAHCTRAAAAHARRSHDGPAQHIAAARPVSAPGPSSQSQHHTQSRFVRTTHRDTHARRPPPVFPPSTSATSAATSVCRVCTPCARAPYLSTTTSVHSTRLASPPPHRARNAQLLCQRRICADKPPALASNDTSGALRAAAAHSNCNACRVLNPPAPLLGFHCLAPRTHRPRTHVHAHRPRTHTHDTAASTSHPHVGTLRLPPSCRVGAHAHVHSPAHLSRTRAASTPAHLRLVLPRSTATPKPVPHTRTPPSPSPPYPRTTRTPLVGTRAHTHTLPPRINAVPSPPRSPLPSSHFRLARTPPLRTSTARADGHPRPPTPTSPTYPRPLTPHGLPTQNGYAASLAPSTSAASNYANSESGSRSVRSVATAPALSTFFLPSSNSFNPFSRSPPLGPRSRRFGLNLASPLITRKPPPNKCAPASRTTAVHLSPVHLLAVPHTRIAATTPHARAPPSPRTHATPASALCTSTSPRTPSNVTARRFAHAKSPPYPVARRRRAEGGRMRMCIRPPISAARTPHPHPRTSVSYCLHPALIPSRLKRDSGSRRWYTRTADITASPSPPTHRARNCREWPTNVHLNRQQARPSRSRTHAPHARPAAVATTRPFGTLRVRRLQQRRSWMQAEPFVALLHSLFKLNPQSLQILTPAGKLKSSATHLNSKQTRSPLRMQPPLLSESVSTPIAHARTLCIAVPPPFAYTSPFSIPTHPPWSTASTRPAPHSHSHPAPALARTRARRANSSHSRSRCILACTPCLHARTRALSRPRTRHPIPVHQSSPPPRTRTATSTAALHSHVSAQIRSLNGIAYGEGVTEAQRGAARREIQVLGEAERWTLLRMLEFNSTRKPQSCVYRAPDGKVVMYCKGTDSVVYARLAADHDPVLKEATRRDVEAFANNGPRTLCVAWRVLSQEEYSRWGRVYDSFISSSPPSFNCNNLFKLHIIPISTPWGGLLVVVLAVVVYNLHKHSTSSRTFLHSGSCNR
ncbi:hypothetical protein B0H16DRAFT_1720993 [Mycena metata]|uniref:Uncharacterized protein n=1 Tax=Mycena metata TaxID=1033252 RepID=A0AAD7NFC9_9AGAR|nr:hypothetical protein B0H16DRAFT_1720993 [Mycena metata]